LAVNCRHHEAGRYLTLNLYVATCLAGSIWNAIVIHVYGYASYAYAYSYYYVDCITSVFSYFVIAGFYERVCEKLHASWKIRLGGFLILLATAWLSLGIVQSSREHLTTRFVMELSRNLNFMGVLLTYILWGGYLRTRQKSLRMVQLISALGIYYSFLALYYGLRMFFHDWFVTRLIPAVLSTFLPCAWAYAFLTTREDDRAVTVTVADVATNEPGGN
jgi:hypothetical protein